MNMVEENKRNIPVKGEYDVIVAGSGPSGISAALRAARAGAKTLVIEQNGCLGGMWTSGLLGWILCHDNPESYLLNLYKTELLKRGSPGKAPTSGSFAFEPETMKFLLEELCQKEGLDVRLYTMATGVRLDESGKINYLFTESKSGCEAWKAKVFIDATGDGDLGALAGCHFDFGEPETGRTQPMSLLAILTGVRLDEILPYVNGHTPRHKAVNALHDLLASQGAEPSYHDATIFYFADDIFFLMANHAYQVSGCSADDLTRATMMARKEIHEQIAALRKCGPAWEHVRVAATAERIGVREGRRLHGLYTVSLEDILEGKEQPDPITKITMGIDVHALSPSKTNGFANHSYKSKPYDLPLRSLISADIPNLILTGRCISGDFYAHAGYRVMGHMVPIGEASGVLAALSVKENRDPKDIPFEVFSSNFRKKD